MQRTIAGWLTGLLIMVAAASSSAPLHAQSMDVKEKPGLYTYMASWQLPRAKWADAEKPNAGSEKILSQAVAGGTLVAYGVDKTEVHHLDGSTHDTFWSAMSMSAVLDVLDALSKGSPDPMMQYATKHSDTVFLSHYYNWKPGNYKGAYTHSAYYKLRESAPSDALDTLSKHFFVPVLEKLLSEGSIVEYEIDKEVVHTESPYGFWIVVISSDSAGLDKMSKALGNAYKADVFASPALRSVVEFGEHRDYLARTVVTFK